MMPRHEVFPHVIEMNYQARRRLGCCVYLVHDADEWLLIDIGYEDTLDDIVKLIREMDFPLANCRYLIATHADVDHVQALKRAKEIMPQAKVVGHRQAAKLLATGERIMTYAEIAAEGGGILSTVAATRAAPDDELLAATRRRLDEMLACGTTTCEAKSGYGLTTESELKQLRVLRALNASHAIDIKSTKQERDKFKYFAPVTSGDFDQNYEPINASYPGPVGSAYTVRSGDTLTSIAQSVWGDSAMWYLLAEANGLSGGEALVEGQVLVIPNKVTNIHNNANTFRPYNPGEVIGNVDPTVPPPPPPAGKGGCGGIGMILKAVGLKPNGRLNRILTGLACRLLQRRQVTTDRPRRPPLPRWSRS